ncbi:MAG: hypothetical protein AAFY26_03340 [Cyanobacteria bacterium J06638_22]|jgi:hypothetical protein
MAQQLKRWESPRRKGRNDKGRGGSARQRQLRKQFKTLKKKLNQDNKSGGRESSSLPLLFWPFRERHPLLLMRRA